MKTYEQLIFDIRAEESALNEKLTRLESFMMSADFIKLSPVQKQLLERQHSAMVQYKTILIQRAHRINFEHTVAELNSKECDGSCKKEC